MKKELERNTKVLEDKITDRHRNQGTQLTKDVTKF